MIDPAASALFDRAEDLRREVLTADVAPAAATAQLGLLIQRAALLGVFGVHRVQGGSVAAPVDNKFAPNRAFKALEAEAVMSNGPAAHAFAEAFNHGNHLTVLSETKTWAAEGRMAALAKGREALNRSLDDLREIAGLVRLHTPPSSAGGPYRSSLGAGHPIPPGFWTYCRKTGARLYGLENIAACMRGPLARYSGIAAESVTSPDETWTEDVSATEPHGSSEDTSLRSYVARWTAEEEIIRVAVYFRYRPEHDAWEGVGAEMFDTDEAFDAARRGRLVWRRE